MSHDGAARADCNRRNFLRLLAGSAVAATYTGCHKSGRRETRVGFLPNLTHAVPMAMELRGTLAGAVGRPVRMVPFGAGPSFTA